MELELVPILSMAVTVPSKSRLRASTVTVTELPIERLEMSYSLTLMETFILS